MHVKEPNEDMWGKERGPGKHRTPHRTAPCVMVWDSPMLTLPTIYGFSIEREKW